MSAGSRGVTRIEEPTRAQRAVARRAAESRATIPAIESAVEVTLGTGTDLSTALLLEACAAALRAVPKANGAYRDGRFELYERVNIGLVVPSGDALAIPVVFDADRKSRQQLAEESRRLSERAIAGTLTAPEASGATITLLDAAEHAVASVSPLIVPPHAAAVGVGAPRVIHGGQAIQGGRIHGGQAVTVTLASDHRILYGVEAFRFLAAIKSGIESG